MKVKKDGFLSVSEVSFLFGCSEQTLRCYDTSGIFTADKIDDGGHRWYETDRVLNILRKITRVDYSLDEHDFLSSLDVCTKLDCSRSVLLRLENKGVLEPARILFGGK